MSGADYSLAALEFQHPLMNIRIAVMFSVGLHLVILAVVYFSQVKIPGSEEDKEKRSYLEITLGTAPQTQADPATESDTSVTPPLNPVTEIEPASPPLAPVSDLVVTNSNEEQNTEPVQTAINPISGISVQELNNALANFSSNYRKEHSNNLLDECLRYKNQHGVKTCPEGSNIQPANEEREIVAGMFKTWVTGHDDNARESRKLLDEMDAMQPLLKEKGMLGELARQRYTLAEHNYIYLIPDEGGGDIIPVLTIAGSRLALFSGLLTISLKGEVSVGDDSLKGPALPYRPYQLSGDKKEEEEAEDSFKMQAPLFPTRR